MAGEVTDQQLIDAGTDASNLALIVNGPASGAGSTVALRNGTTSPTIAKTLSLVEKGDPGDMGPAGPSSTPSSFVPASGATQSLAFSAFGDIAYDITLSANAAINFSGVTGAGTIVGAPTFGTGKFGNGLTASSDSNYISIPSTTIPRDGSAYTFELWVKTPASSTTEAVAIAWGGSDSNVAFMGMMTSGNAFVGVSSVTPDNDTGVSINDGAWHHIAVVITATTCTVFIDGVQATTQTGTLQPPASTDLGYIGRFSVTGLPWMGAIDEIAVWRGARYTANFTPPAEPYTGTEAGLAVLYHLNGNAGSGLNLSQYNKITLVIRPNGFQATLPPSSPSIVWAGGVAPIPSTSAITVLTMGFTGLLPILGGI